MPPLTLRRPTCAPTTREAATLAPTATWLPRTEPAETVAPIATWVPLTVGSAASPGASPWAGGTEAASAWAGGTELAPASGFGAASVAAATLKPTAACTPFTLPPA
ncbi:MAG TPA: hypothetical protein VN033_01720 [Vulgatibacter sp.]|nr:hypothetical protein [Vulgatibacter sp.]